MVVVSDEGWDTDGLREHWHRRGIAVRVRSKPNRVVQHAYNEDVYWIWHIVENSFNLLKDFRRMSLWLDKTNTSSRASNRSAIAILNWRLKIKLCP